MLPKFYQELVGKTWDLGSKMVIREIRRWERVDLFVGDAPKIFSGSW